MKRWGLGAAAALCVIGLLFGGPYLAWRYFLSGQVLLEAARQNNSTHALWLISGGALTDGRDDAQRTPLHFAVDYGNARLARALLEAGADPDAADLWNRTPLHLAARERHVGIARMLLESGAAPNAAANAGWTALHYAADERDARMALLLLKYAADPELKNGEARTPVDLWPAMTKIIRQVEARGGKD